MHPNFNPPSHTLARTDSFEDATLQRIDRLVQDVEMQAAVGESTICLVVDTNILLQRLALLQHFTRDVEMLRLPVLIIIPGAVLNELDGQKKSDRLGWFARRASEWLLEKVKQRNKGQATSVRGQTNYETCKPSGNWRIRQPGDIFGERGNDALILDCCMYFGTKFRTALCSADKNLCIESESLDVKTISPKSGKELATFLFGGDTEKFAPYEAEYAGIDSLEEQDDSMDVDEVERRMTAEEALDSLHDQVVDHFTRLLVQLVGRVGGPALEDWYPGQSDSGVSASRYAPKWKNNDKPYTEWTAADCLSYLDEKKRQKRSEPRLDLFLRKRYSGPGSRCGREWSYKAWSTALDALKQIGDDWNEASLREDLHELACHREAVFGIGR